jgi:hypothetical protein
MQANQLQNVSTKYTPTSYAGVASGVGLFFAFYAEF